jgi:hypothetical protein
VWCVVDGANKRRTDANGVYQPNLAAVAFDEVMGNGQQSPSLGCGLGRLYESVQTRVVNAY